MLGGMLTSMGNTERVDLLCARRPEIPKGGRGIGSINGSWMTESVTRVSVLSSTGSFQDSQAAFRRTSNVKELSI